MRWRGGFLTQWLLLLVPLGLVGYFGGRRLWAEHHLRAAQDALRQRQFAEAREHLRCCLKVWPERAEVQFLAAQAARRAGDLGRAEHHLAEGERRGGPTPASTLERLLLAAQQGDLRPEVESPLRTRVQQDARQTPLILEALTQGYLFAYRLGDALECVQRLLRLQPDHVQALVWRGWVWEGLQRYPEAETDYRRAVDLDPDDFQARRRLAEVLLTFKGPQEAERHFERLNRQRPSHFGVRLGLARCRLQLGQGSRARPILVRLLAETPDDATVLRELGKVALGQGRTAEAEKWLRRALAADRSDSDTCYTLAQCLSRKGRRTEAGQFLARSRQIQADVQRLRELIEKMGRAPRDPDLRREAGVICLRNGQPQEALRWFTGALQIDSQHAPTHRALADYYTSAGKAELAAQHRRLAGQGRAPARMVPAPQ